MSQKLTHIELRPSEIQSGLDRVRWAELLIQQLPEDHDGRNSWLLNFGGDKHVADKRHIPITPTIDDAAVERALAAWYPEEWPHDPLFAPNTTGLRERTMKEMRAALLAAFEQPK